jgi:hypothetical protein
MSVPLIGQLFPEPYQPTPKQPGGIGTPVTDPLQTVYEKTGMFFGGCGHSFNSWVIQQTSVGGVPQKLATCPLCGYCQQVLTVSAFDNNPFTFIA